jgi:hypothetical protein
MFCALVGAICDLASPTVEPGPAARVPSSDMPAIAVAGHDGIRAAASASKRLCASQKGRRQVATKVGLTQAAPPGATPFSLLAVYRASSRRPDRSRSARLPVLSPSIRAFPGGSEAWSPCSSPSLSGRIRHSPAPSGRRTVTQGSLATPSWRPPNALVESFPSRQERWPAFLATLCGRLLGVYA